MSDWCSVSVNDDAVYLQTYSFLVDPLAPDPHARNRVW